MRGIDTSAAAALPGVRCVLTAADLNPGVHEQWHTSIGPQSPETPRPPLAEDEVRFVGDPVALVVAESRYVAEDAVDLVVVDYEPLPPVVDYVTAGSAEALVHAAHGSNVIGQVPGRAPRRWRRRSRRRRTSPARRSASRATPRCRSSAAASSSTPAA